MWAPCYNVHLAKYLYDVYGMSNLPELRTIVEAMLALVGALSAAFVPFLLEKERSRRDLIRMQMGQRRVHDTELDILKLALNRVADLGESSQIPELRAQLSEQAFRIATKALIEVERIEQENSELMAHGRRYDDVDGKVN